MDMGVGHAQANGVKITVEPYGSGPQYIKKSLNEMARLMREARHDTRLASWASQVLRAKGLDGRNRPQPTVRAQSEALLDALRAQTIYKPDPAGSEWIQAPHVTLCLGDLCIPAEDCDGLTTALGGALLNLGIQTFIVKQYYGPDAQEHVLVGVIDEKGKKWYADPSTHKPMTMISQAVDEVWLDPLEEIGSIGVSGAEIVTLGRPPKERETYFKGGMWWEFAQGRWWVYDKGQWVMGPREPIAEGLGAISYAENTFWKNVGGGSQIPIGLGVICTTDSLTGYKRRLQGPWNSLKGDLDRCPKLTIDQHYSFNADDLSFQKWIVADMPFCDADAEIREGQDFEARYNSWRKIALSLGCTPTEPELVSLSDLDPRSPNYKPAESELARNIKEISSGVLMIGGVAAAIYGLYVAAPLISAVSSRIGSTVTKKEKKKEASK